MEDEFEHERPILQQTGQIYSKLWEYYDEKDIRVDLIDPRNHLALLNYFLKHWKQQNITVRDLVNSMFRGIKRGSIFVNGKWVNHHEQVTEGNIITIIETNRSA